MQIRTGIRRERKSPLPALALALCLILLFLGTNGCARTVSIGGQKVPLETVSLDIRHAGVTDIKPLLKLSMLSELDLRGNDITVADYESLRAALPDCHILWSVPIATLRADSDSTALKLPDFSAEDTALLAYFPALNSVDAAGCTDYAALKEAARLYPNCAFSWTVPLCGKSLPFDTAELDLSGQTVSLTELETALAGLPQLTQLDLRGTGLDTEALAALISARPELRFVADVTLFGEHYDADTTEIDLSGAGALDVDTLIATLGHFTALEHVNLRGRTLSGDERLALMEAYPALRFSWEIELLPGLMVDSDMEELVVKGYDAPDVGTLIEGLRYLPQLKKLDLVACYSPSEATNLEMDKLLAAYPEKKFVWLVRVGNWELRTDITAFSMGNQKTFPGGRFVGGAIYPSATNERIVPLKYCTDLIALDMGHAKKLTDISCLAGLTKIRYLILGMTSINNIDALAGMTELEFLELYQNWTSDLSPLLHCKKLKYLNCSTTFVETIDDIIQMKQLKRLWIMKPQVLTKDDIAAIKAALPNTIIRNYMWAGGHSTTGGWRTKNPAYLHMQRDLFDLPLQDQSVTQIGDKEYWDWDIEAFEAQ